MGDWCWAKKKTHPSPSGLTNHWSDFKRGFPVLSFVLLDDAKVIRGGGGGRKKKVELPSRKRQRAETHTDIVFVVDRWGGVQGTGRQRPEIACLCECVSLSPSLSLSGLPGWLCHSNLWLTLMAAFESHFHKKSYYFVCTHVSAFELGLILLLGPGWAIIFFLARILATLPSVLLSLFPLPSPPSVIITGNWLSLRQRDRQGRWQEATKHDYCTIAAHSPLPLIELSGRVCHISELLVGIGLGCRRRSQASTTKWVIQTGVVVGKPTTNV